MHPISSATNTHDAITDFVTHLTGLKLSHCKLCIMVSFLKFAGKIVIVKGNSQFIFFPQ